VDFKYLKNLKIGIMIFKAGQGFLNLITFTDFDPANPKNVTLKLANVKIFGRNLERSNVLRVKSYEDHASIYYRN
jgi:hypothetical protein